MEHDKFGLTGNQLKLIALIAMTVDHVGVYFFPDVLIFRIIGRLAFPIFAFMIAEGCRYTHHRVKYVSIIAGIAIGCQVVYFATMGSLYMGIMVTFTISILMIYLFDYVLAKPGVIRWTAALAALFLVGFLCYTLPLLLPHTDYMIDYSFFGILLPVGVYFGKTKMQKLGIMAAILVPICLEFGEFQWFSLAALLLLFVYNGARGKRKLKYLFYIYYPAHLAALYSLSILIY